MLLQHKKIRGTSRSGLCPLHVINSSENSLQSVSEYESCTVGVDDDRFLAANLFGEQFL